MGPLMLASFTTQGSPGLESSMDKWKKLSRLEEAKLTGERKTC
jgi:hypothetical protein